MLAAVLPQLCQWQHQAAQRHIRLPVIWQGSVNSLLDATTQLLAQLSYSTLYWIGGQAPADAIVVSDKQNYQLLGSECDVLVINAFDGFPADLIAASAGCVKAGGIWLLLCPPFAAWQTQPNPAHKAVLPYPLDAANHHGQFIAFWLAQVSRQNVVLLQDEEVLQQLNWPSQPVPYLADAPCLTVDQQRAVAAILHVSSGHRRRPLVITADRGRGKSAALGIAAAKLAAAGKHIVLTAPSPQAAQTAINHFQQLSPVAQHSQLQFIPFDKLLQSSLTADLLLIDEAAAIPSPVLQQLLQRFSRIVFATTEHGYEGTGRGFQLRFQQHLTAQCPGWKKLQLQQPIRYQQYDVLEQLIFKSFLLEQVQAATPFNADSAVSFDCYSARDWLTNAARLQQVFGLLSLAHYQTQVKDLAALLDNPQLRVFTLQQHDRLLACALISLEGNFSQALATQVYHAERRVQGHLLAQSLAFHLAQPQLATMNLWRVMRIAVQPALQRQQLGSRLLQHVSQQANAAGVNYLGTSFGVTPELLQFWQQAGYRPVRLGVSSDKASAEYSVLMLQAVTSSNQVAHDLQQQFGQLLFHSLPQYPLLDPALALVMATPPLSDQLTATELQQLRLFSLNKRPYELVQHLLLRWFNLHVLQLPAKLRLMLCALLWQQIAWPELLQQFSFTNKKALISYIAGELAKTDTL